MRRSQCVLDLRGRLAAGEQEAEVAITLGQRTDGTVAADRDLEPGDARHGPRLVLAAHLPSTPARGIGKHHHARRRRLAAEVAERQPERVAQDHLLEAHTHAEAKRARAQPADRARRELEHPHALVVDAQLRVDGALAQPERRAGIRGRAGHGRDDLAGSRDGVVKIVSSK